MRILHVYFTPPEEGPARAGGIAGYIRNLCASQRELGHEVGVLSSGSVFTPGVDGDEVGACHAERLGDWEGVSRWVIKNSPFVAPALWQFAASPRETESPVLNRVLAGVVREWGADVVHVHSLEGLAASCLGAARDAGARVFMSLHNHHPFCPQVYLMRGRRHPCLDYEGGEACVNCEASIDIERERERRAGVVQGPPPSIEPPALPPILRFEENDDPSLATEQLLKAGHPLWEPLMNEPPDAERARVSLNAFGERRRAMVRALNACDGVLAVSTFVREIAVSMGTRPDIARILPIGTRTASLIPNQSRSDDDVLRIVFLGFNNYYKGLPMLIDAIACLSSHLRGRVHLSAHGPGCPSIRERAEAIRPRLSGLTLGGAYQPDEIDGLLERCDLGAVPSVWWDNGPQTLMEFQARGVPVIVSRLGGIPDRVTHDENGLLFRGNDRFDAAKQIERALTEPGLLERLRQGARTTRDAMGGLKAHAEAIVDAYTSTLESPPRLGQAVQG